MTIQSIYLQVVAGMKVWLKLRVQLADRKSQLMHSTLLE